jgi:GAF domain-containing protein
MTQNGSANIPASKAPAADACGPLTAETYAELAGIVVGAQPLTAVLRRLADVAVKALPGADDASITLMERGRPRTVAFSGQLAVALDERQYEAGFGPCMDAAMSGQTILVDAHQEHRYRDFCWQARRRGIRHVLSVGMPTLQQTRGALNIYGSGAAGSFDQAAQDAASSLAGYAAVTLFNAAIYAGALDEVAQMKQAMLSRAAIEQAKGILMALHGCSADQAFAVLVDTSSRSHRKVRDVAHVIIEQATAH